MAELSYTQLDPSVLSELPQDVRDELAAMLPPSSRTGAHSKPTNTLRPYPDGSNPATAHAHLLDSGRQLGNKAISLQQQRDQAHSQTGQDKGVRKEGGAVHEPANELWSELHLALEGLSAAAKACTMASNASNLNKQQQTESEEKFDALYQIVLQWTHCQVESNLEDVHYLLRRLVGYTAASDMIQLGIVRLVKAIQQHVKSAHGAKLQLQQPLD